MSTNWKSEGGFAFLKHDFKERLSAPVGHTNFWGYLFISILGLGGLSIYIEAVKYWVGTTTDSSGVILALFTVFPAVMGASSVQLVLDKDNSPTRMAGTLLLLLTLGLTLLFLTNVMKVSPSWSVFWGIVFCGLSVIVWWIANGYEDIFKDQINRPDASLGPSDPNVPLHGSINGDK